MPAMNCRYRLFMVFGLLALLGAGCGNSGDSAQHPPSGTKAKQALTKVEQAPMPEWVKTQNAWPDTIRWTVDSSYDVTLDDLTLRIYPTISQDISWTRFQNERPLICEVVTTMSPVPEWSYARGFKVDSVLLRDPVGHKAIHSMPLLSFQRNYEDGTVRTQFLENLIDANRQSPDLIEGQRLDMTIFMSWDGRQMIATMPPATLAFLRNPEEGVKHEPEIDYPPTGTGTGTGTGGRP